MERQHEVERWLLSNANHLFPTMVSDMCNGLPHSLKMILEDDTTDKLRVRGVQSHTISPHPARVAWTGGYPEAIGRQWSDSDRHPGPDIGKGSKLSTVQARMWLWHRAL